MKTQYYLAMLAASFFISCESDFLEVKSRSDLVVPHTLKDFEQLLDNGQLMYSGTELMEVSADDYQLEHAYWLNISDVTMKNAHIWAKDIYETIESESAWSIPFEQIFYANVVLDGLQHVARMATNEAKWGQIKGSALFIRAHALYNLAQLFAPAFDEASANNDLGLPLPLSSDVNERVYRSSVRETYDRILLDLHDASGWLQESLDFSRPTQSAVDALLARVYLSMGRFAEAKDHAGRCLAVYNNLTNLNGPTARHYSECIYLGYSAPLSVLKGFDSNIIVSTELYGSYEEGDLRKEVYFRLNTNGQPYRRVPYGLGISYYFTGLDTDEMYLIRAECSARAGDIQDALADLNHLLKHRYRSDTFVERETINAGEMVQMVLVERRKELFFRNLRWTDLRRLNILGENITIQRHMDAVIYSLEPGSPNWVLPIPNDEIALSGIPQNIRH